MEPVFEALLTPEGWLIQDFINTVDDPRRINLLELTDHASKQTDWLASKRSTHMIGVQECNISDWLQVIGLMRLD